jgi:hypothetical protein
MNMTLPGQTAPSIVHAVCWLNHALHVAGRDLI